MIFICGTCKILNAPQNLTIPWYRKLKDLSHVFKIYLHLNDTHIKFFVLMIINLGYFCADKLQKKEMCISMLISLSKTSGYTCISWSGGIENRFVHSLVFKWFSLFQDL